MDTPKRRNFEIKKTPPSMRTRLMGLLPGVFHPKRNALPRLPELVEPGEMDKECNLPDKNTEEVRAALEQLLREIEAFKLDQPVFLVLSRHHQGYVSALQKAVMDLLSTGGAGYVEPEVTNVLESLFHYPKQTPRWMVWEKGRY